MGDYYWAAKAEADAEEWLAIRDLLTIGWRRYRAGYKAWRQRQLAAFYRTKARGDEH